MRHMTPAHFREHFADSAAGTTAESAALDIATCNDTTAPYAQGILLEAVDVE
jgi:pyridoxine/pyridoxamine 5'-phosphate oxidase